MIGRAVADRSQNEAPSRQTFLLDLDTTASTKQTRQRCKNQAGPRPEAKTQGHCRASEIAEGVRDELKSIQIRLAALEALLSEVHDRTVQGSLVKEYYTTQEVARILSKRPYTVREWCRLGRVRGEKSHSGRGLDVEWRIGHVELTRIQNEGLLPIQKTAVVERPRRLK